MSKINNLPPQQLPFSRKTKKWRKQHLDWADSKALISSGLVRKSVINKKINYDLINGKLHMQDLMLILNPDNVRANYVPDKIQHYPIMNSKLNVLRGEESKRIFDFKAVVTNPNAISEIETNKRDALLEDLKSLLSSNAKSEEEFNSSLEKLNEFYLYEWQDLKEIRANAILNHYIKEYNIPLLFNNGFMDALTVGEEIYQCDIVGGEPIIERVNPQKIRIFQSGYSNRIEDADIIVLEDYWSPGRIIDTFYESLSKKDIEYLENVTNKKGSTYDSMDNIDERYGFIQNHMMGEEFIDTYSLFTEDTNNSLLPYDFEGNVRVIRMYWKSRRRIKKVKSYDPQTGEEVFHFYPETYIIDEDMGEEEKIYYINEAWEGTKIGEDIYVNMRPRVVQYNRLSNPSRCHSGIIGSIYNLNEGKPFSLVDMMKHYNYLYDVIHDRLNKLMASNWGKIVRIDLSKVPKGWDIEKWLYFAKVNKIAVEDSFKEGDYGAASGKLAGGMNNASSGIIDAELGNSIQYNINLLEFIKMEMSEVAGITRQREGQISNRETVGGVERATLQSSHITEWLFFQHDDLKRRVLECFLETTKIALRGRNKKFQYILSDNSRKIIDIEGDEFAEADYGIVVDNDQNIQELSQKLDLLAQAALQNQTLSFSTVMKLYSSSSIAEKQRFVERDEAKIKDSQAKAQQEEMKQREQEAQMLIEQKKEELQQKESANIRDNETKFLVAQLQAVSNNKDDGISEDYSPERKEELLEKIRQFNEKLKLDKEKLEFDKKKHNDEISLKRQSLKKKSSNNKVK